MARKYSVWNAAVAALQFWTADLEVNVLSGAIKQVYNAFFYSTSTHLLHQQSDEILSSHFMTTLNTSLESKLALEDEGYESSSENFHMPTPLRRTSKITMFPLLKMHLLIQTQLHCTAWVQGSHITDLYVDV